MTASGMVSALSTLGTTGVLLIVLVFLLTKATDERKNITEKFLVTMQEIARTNAEGPIKLAVSLEALTTAIANLQKYSSLEHAEMMDYLRVPRHNTEEGC